MGIGAQQDRRRADAPPWAVLAARFLVGTVAVAAMVARWKAAARWLAANVRWMGLGGGAPGERPEPRGETLGAAATEEVPVPAGIAAGASAKPARSGARWTGEDDAYLAAHAAEPPEVIAHHLGRTPSAVAMRQVIFQREGRGRGVVLADHEETSEKRAGAG